MSLQGLHKSLIILAAFAVVPGGACVSGAVAPTPYVPAGFADGQDSLQGLIEFPEVDGDISILVRCMASVKTDGKIHRGYCLPTPDNQSFIDAIGKLDSRFRLAPARVQGRKTAVWMHYSVRFSQRDGTQTILVFPHHLEDPYEYGDNYTAPQSYHFPMCPVWPVGCERKTIALVSLLIDETGKPIEGSLVDEARPPRCGQPLLKYALNGTYIPAMRDGAPVKAMHVDPFFSVDIARGRNRSLTQVNEETVQLGPEHRSIGDYKLP